ncbi:hypothetical protein [Citrobacter braakii]
MKYFKTEQNEIYAYEDDASEELYQEGLLPISESEAKEILDGKWLPLG